MKKIRSQRNIAMLLIVYVVSLFLTACGSGGNQATIYNVANSQNSAFLLTSDNQMLRTIDGVTWTVDQTSGIAPTDVVVNSTCSLYKCVMVGADGLLKQSSNLLNWSDVQRSSSSSSAKKGLKSAAQSGLYDVVIGVDNTVIAVGESGTVTTFNTNKTTPATTQKIGNSNFYSVTEAVDWNGTPNPPAVYLAIGANGTMAETSDGITWKHIDSHTSSDLYAVSHPNKTYVVVGAQGTILTSNDGLIWTPQTSGTTNSLLTINYLNGKYVAAGINGTIVTSPDGINWTVAPVTGGSVPSDLVNYNIRNVVTTEDSGFLLYGVNIKNPSAPEALFLSADGQNWSDAGFSQNVSSSSNQKNIKLKSFGSFFNSVGNWFKENQKPIIAAVVTVAVVAAIATVVVASGGIGGGVILPVVGTISGVSMLGVVGALAGTSVAIAGGATTAVLATKG